MNNKEIIERAMRIVSQKLDDIDTLNADKIEITEKELLNISTALVVAAVSCRASD